MVYGGSAISVQSSLALLTELTATKNATFLKKRDMEHVASGSKAGLVSTESTSFKSHRGVNFLTGKKVPIRPFQNLVVSGQMKME